MYSYIYFVAGINDILYETNYGKQNTIYDESGCNIIYILSEVYKSKDDCLLERNKIKLSKLETYRDKFFTCNERLYGTLVYKTNVNPLIASNILDTMKELDKNGFTFDVEPYKIV